MAASAWASIKMTDPDGGLKSCFDIVDLAPTLRDALKNKDGITTLRDLATSFTEGDYTE